MTTGNKYWLSHPLLSKLLLIAIISGLVWLSSWRMDYSWKWQSIPAFFISTQTKPIFSSTDGIVESISTTNKQSTINIRTQDNTLSTFIVCTKDLQVKQGDTIFEGDKIGYLYAKKIGPLLKGLYTTLWLSVLSGICGLLVGILLAFIRIHPESMWYGAVSLYIDLIRGTPLLVQLFIIYFFIGALFNLG